VKKLAAATAAACTLILASYNSSFELLIAKLPDAAAISSCFLAR